MAEPIELKLNHQFAFPADKLYRAWTSAESVKAWFGHGDHTVHDVQLDVREGGSYRITLQNADGERFSVGGQYTLVEPPKQLAFTWKWDWQDENVPETLVTLQFNPTDTGSELVLHHENFQNVELRDNHQHGWNAIFAELEKSLTD